MKVESEFDEKYSQHEENYEKKYSEKKNKDQEEDVSINFAEYDDHDNELYYEEFSINSKKKYETFADFVDIETSCLQCKKIFSSRNKLHKHLKTKCKEKSMNKLLTKTIDKNMSSENSQTLNKQSEKSIIVKFIAFKTDKSYELTFRK
jgi:hypothetical protein